MLQSFASVYLSRSQYSFKSMIPIAIQPPAQNTVTILFPPFLLFTAITCHYSICISCEDRLDLGFKCMAECIRRG